MLNMGSNYSGLKWNWDQLDGNRTGMAIMELGQGEILTPISPFNSLEAARGCLRHTRAAGRMSTGLQRTKAANGY